MGGETETIHVLHVDDDEQFAGLTAEMLERHGPFSVKTAPDAAGGLDRLGDSPVDCVVSDYDMPGRNGIKFLETVRERAPRKPFVLFTGKGSESVASDAISAGVTDYLQKGSGTEQYELLANRIETAVGQYRAERELERKNDLFEKAQTIADVGAWEYDLRTDESYVTDETLRIHGLSPSEELPPQRSIQYYHPEDRTDVRAAFRAAVEHGNPYDLELRLITEHGDRRWVRTRGEPQTEDGEVVRVRGTLQDITEQRRRRQQVHRQKERFEEFARVVSHDVRNPLQVAGGQLDRAQETGEPDAFNRVRRAHGRIDDIVSEVLELAEQGREISETERVDLQKVARQAWDTVDTGAASLTTTVDLEVRADPERLRHLFENLFDNAVKHGATSGRPSPESVEHGYTRGRLEPAGGVLEHAEADVSVSIGAVETVPTATRVPGDGPTGFYVADDGPGIPKPRRGEVFQAGYATAEDGSGFGLSIVEQVVEAHSWDITITESHSGGARFEITGIEIVD